MADEPTPSAPPRRDPAIRTMRSDISEFLKTTKPSLVSILVRQAEWEEAHRREAKTGRNFIFTVLMAGALIAAVSVLGILAYRWLNPSTAPETLPPSAAPAYIFYENSLAIDADRSRSALLNDLKAAAGDGVLQAEASFRRLVVSSGGAAVNFDQFFKLTGEGSRPASFAAPAQFFIYRRGERRDMGLIAAPSSPARMLQDLLTAEPSLARNLETLFLGRLPTPTIAPYEDRTYRNISFRYRPMDEGGGRGLGYLYFPAKRLMVIATSEEAIRAAADRLFEQR